MRVLTVVALLAIAATPVAAQQPAAKPAEKPSSAAKPAPKTDAHGHPDKAAKPGDHGAMLESAKMGELPAGWSARMDRGPDMSKVKFVSMPPGYHVTVGPAGIYWRDTDRANGPFHASATIHQMKAPTHPEGYGLFYGGQALDGEGQKYTYFLVRGDGKFLIKQRNGAETANVTEGWVEHAAVTRQNAEGAAMNKLEIDATGGEIRFLVNGQPVHTMAVEPGTLNGLVGLRINHNLDVHVEGFEVN